MLVRQDAACTQFQFSSQWENLLYIIFKVELREIILFVFKRMII